MTQRIISSHDRHDWRWQPRYAFNRHKKKETTYAAVSLDTAAFSISFERKCYEKRNFGIEVLCGEKLLLTKYPEYLDYKSNSKRLILFILKSLQALNDFPSESEGRFIKGIPIRAQINLDGYIIHRHRIRPVRKVLVQSARKVEGHMGIPPYTGDRAGVK